MSKLTATNSQAPHAFLYLWKHAMPFIVVIVASRLIASVMFPQFDDSFITLRYARNLSMGFGFVFNHGEWILGVSCPLFGLFESLLFFCHLPMPQSILVFNILVDVAMMFVGMRLLREFVGRTSAIVFALVFSLNPTLARVCIGCMEADIFMLAVVGALWLFFRGKPKEAMTIASFSFFIRPEAVIVVILILILELRHGSLGSACKLSALSLMIVAPGLWAMNYFYGEFFPQSVLTKLGLSGYSVLQPIHGLFLRDPISITLLPLAGIGIFTIHTSGRVLQAILAFAGVLTIVYLVSGVDVPTWYAEPSQYGVSLLASLALGRIIDRWASVSERLRHGLNQAVLCALTIMVWAIGWWHLGPSKVTRNIYGGLKAWGNSEDLRHASIMANDIGARGFYTDAHILDLDGLVSHYRIRGLSNMLDFIRFQKPDYLFLDDLKDSYVLINESIISEEYKISSFILQSPSDSSFRYSNSWSQNYIILKRKNP